MTKPGISLEEAVMQFNDWQGCARIYFDRSTGTAWTQVYSDAAELDKYPNPAIIQIHSKATMLERWKRGVKFSGIPASVADMDLKPGLELAAAVFGKEKNEKIAPAEYQRLHELCADLVREHRYSARWQQVDDYVTTLPDDTKDSYIVIGYWDETPVLIVKDPDIASGAAFPQEGQVFRLQGTYEATPHYWVIKDGLWELASNTSNPQKVTPLEELSWSTQNFELATFSGWSCVGVAEGWTMNLIGEHVKAGNDGRYGVLSFDDLKDQWDYAIYVGDTESNEVRRGAHRSECRTFSGWIRSFEDGRKLLDELIDVPCGIQAKIDSASQGNEGRKMFHAAGTDQKPSLQVKITAAKAVADEHNTGSGGRESLQRAR